MTEAVKRSLGVLKKGEYKTRRIDNTFDMGEELREIPMGLWNSVMLERMLERETPYLLEGDRFGFNRTLKDLPSCVIEWKGEVKRRKIFGGNFTPNYKRVMETGFDGILTQICNNATDADEKGKEFYEAMERSVLAMQSMADRYCRVAEQEGNRMLADALSHVPAQPARSFYEACVFFKLLIYSFRCSGVNHITLGRFDQYMLSYYLADRERGISREELLETLELLFISLNVDGDIYEGIQTGDNGQSMVLGGFDADENSLYNDLSALCMEASMELSLIDPKINLRVGKNTPDWLYEYGTKMTKQGLGFPQYCNDDVIVPYMMSLGYEKEDAYNYTVAACWEVISPNNGADEDNRGTLNFPLVVNRAIHAYLEKASTFDELLSFVCKEIAAECKAIQNGQKISDYREWMNYPVSIAVDGCLEKGRSVYSGGAKYYNYGCHGAGIANAADALAAIRTLIYEETSLSAKELLSALNANFEGYESLRNRLLSCPKMGNNDDRVDAIADRLMTAAEDAMHGKPNGWFGGVWRMGTGSAMEYVLSAKMCPATADGRGDGEPYGCSFSPSISVKLNGPLSVIQSFTKHKMDRISNGGPLTIELHDTVFRNEEGEKKVAQLVKAFIHLGGHQLQLNSINRDRLLDAQAHPENHKNLIVRVWGWSGYFCELDPEYQNHIIARTEFSV
ncbi:MAG: pyruvate formate-lyase [Clostridia bacterium]|nr:pyruvate formate-lyase [Clostridia bacterium]